MYFMLYQTFKICFLVSLVYIGVQFWLQKKEFVFSDKIVEEIALKHKGRVDLLKIFKNESRKVHSLHEQSFTK